MTREKQTKASESFPRTFADPKRAQQSASISTSDPFETLPAGFGRFLVRRLLSHGAMGTVYLAFDPEMSRDVAIKIPKVNLAQDPVLWERFQREARAAGDLNHQNICGMYEVGQIGSTHYIEMEYIDGRPLSDYISNGQSQRRIAGVIRKLAVGLAHAHERRIVHRDLKPENVMIDVSGEPKLMDFGLARRLKVSGDIRATQSGLIVGSPAYMAPEQVRADSEAIGPLTDIYGLGVVFYEMLTGSLPFCGPLAVVLSQVESDQPPLPSSLRPDVDRDLESLCLQMLAKEQRERPQSMNAVVQALTDWLKSDNSSPPPPPSNPGNSFSRQATQSPVRQYLSRIVKGGLPSIPTNRVFILAVLGVVLVAAVSLLNRNDRRPDIPPVTPASLTQTEPVPTAPTPIPIARAPVPARPIRENLPLPHIAAVEPPVPPPAVANSLPPHLELVDELQSGGSKRGLWVAPDALRIYWERNDAISGKVFVATRTSTKDSFGKPELLFSGRHPSLSADERTIVFTLNGKLQTATRSDRNRSFAPPHPIAELQNSNEVKTPSLTADGLQLVWFNAPGADQPKRFWVSHRASSTQAWSRPEVINITGVANPAMISWPQLLDGGRTLLCNDESDAGGHRFILLRRKTPTGPFDQLVQLEPLGIAGIFGRAPRHVPATDELYFLSTRSREIRIAADDDNFMKESEAFRLTGVSHTIDREVIQALTGVAPPPGKPIPPESRPPAATEPALDKRFIDLFNGRDLTGWHGVSRPLDANQLKTAAGRRAQQESDDAAARQAWKVNGGTIVGTATHANLATNRDYGNFEFELEYRIDPNSDGGIFLRGCPQVQIWDAVQNPEGSGGLYNNQHHAKQPLRNADKPPGQWNSIHIKMIGPRVWVTLNGELVTDGVEMEDQYELDGKLVPATGPIALQSYNGRIAYRNLRIHALNADGK